MTVLPHRRPGSGRRPVLWAWTAVALTPVGWALAIVLAFLGGAGEAEGLRPATLGALSLLAWTAAPTVAAVLSLDAARTGRRTGRIAVFVAWILLPTTIALLPVLSFGRAWILALLIVAGTLVLLRPRRPTSPPPFDWDADF